MLRSDIDIRYIDSGIKQISDYVHQVQKSDGSFDSVFVQPNSDSVKSWMHWPVNSPYDTANVLFPLIMFDVPSAEPVLIRGIDYLISKSYKSRYWRYPSLNEDYKFPFDTASTSLCSFLLRHRGFFCDNVSFLNRFINTKDNYSLYIDPPIWFALYSSFKDYRVLKRAYKECCFTKVSPDDWEFTDTCINLLYAGFSDTNNRVWDEVQSAFNNNKIRLTYYNLEYSVYSYARLTYFSGRKLRTDRLFEYLKNTGGKSENPYFLNHVLLANSILYINHHVNDFDELFYRCFEEVVSELYKSNYAYYSSHNRLDAVEGNGNPVSHFGSSAFAASLYIEFLSLFKRRFFSSN